MRFISSMGSCESIQASGSLFRDNQRLSNTTTVAIVQPLRTGYVIQKRTYFRLKAHRHYLLDYGRVRLQTKSCLDWHPHHYKNLQSWTLPIQLKLISLVAGAPVSTVDGDQTFAIIWECDSLGAKWDHSLYRPMNQVKKRAYGNLNYKGNEHRGSSVV